MALPAELTDRIEEFGLDLVIAGSAVMVSIVAFWGLKTLGRKLGWWSSGGAGGHGGHLAVSSSAVAAFMRSCG